MTDINDFYDRIYSPFDTLTPIRADCGKLCGGRCCKGGSRDGMILFCGEEEFLNGVRFLKISRDSMQGREVYFAVCRGCCRREYRPLSCRIFPFVPILKDGEIAVEFDPRAGRMCPLAQDTEREFIEKDFIAAVKSAGEQILTLPEGREFMTAYTQMLDEYRRFAL